MTRWQTSSILTTIPLRSSPYSPSKPKRLEMMHKKHDRRFDLVSSNNYIYVGGEIKGYSEVVADVAGRQNYGVGTAEVLVNQVKERFPTI